MTDFKSHLNSRRRRKATGKWQGILAVIVTLTLISVIALGFLKGIKLKGSFVKSIWDGSSPIAIALNTNPRSVIIYLKEAKKVAFLVIPSDINYVTGDAGEPVRSVISAIKDDPKGGRNFLTKYFGAKIAGYLQFKNEKKMDEIGAEQIFKDFAFLTTPVSIILNGLNGEIKETNLSRIDLLKLWWQVKGINLDDLEFVDLGKYTIEIIEGDGGKFNGLDRDIIRKSLSSYFENFKVVGAHIEVDIVNASGESGMGILASDIAEIAGFDVTGIESDDSLLDKTKITVFGSKSETGHLAKLFDCDIYRLQSESGEAKITLLLGRDFAKAYR